MVDRPTQRENIEREIACFSLCDLCVCMVTIGGGSVRLVVVVFDWCWSHCLFLSSVFCLKARMVWWLHLGDRFDEILKSLSHHRGVVTSAQVFSAKFTINNKTGALNVPPENDSLA